MQSRLRIAGTLFFYLASITSTHAGGSTYYPSCYDSTCKSSEFLTNVNDYLDEQGKFLVELNTLVSQRPMTHKHRNIISALITSYTDKLLPKFTKIKFTMNCNGEFCFKDVEKTQADLKVWDCELSDMLSEAIINKDTF